MLKKLAAFVFCAGFSMSAFAGYVRYNFSYGNSYSGLNGFFVQHDTDQSIAYFEFQLNDPARGFGAEFRPMTGEGDVLLSGASTYFRTDGPTNFDIVDTFGADHETLLSVTFSRLAGGDFAYTAKYSADLWANFPPEVHSGTLRGIATRGTVAPELADYLDSMGGYEFGVPRIVPTFIEPQQVPEPGSIALIGLGTIGIAGLARRRTPLARH
jgi:hypothetical protein